MEIANALIEQEEKEAVLAVLASGQLAQGERVAAFERRFADLCQVREAVAVSSGTAALHLALIAHEIGYGDEVITTPFSFAATANVIVLVGAIPVFVDIDPSTYNIDLDLIEAAITPRTKAILPVHLYGNPCDMLRLEAIAIEYNLLLIEDACQAHAASVHGKLVGSFGTGCFSFNSTKNITTGEGGIVTTDDALIAERVRLLRSHGQQEPYHQIALGFNMRMTEIQAALGLAQLDKLERFTEARIANAAYLTEHLSGIVQTPVVLEGHRHVFHHYTIRVPQEKDRGEFAARLRERGVPTTVLYPCPLHQQPYYLDSPELFRIAKHAEGASESAEKLRTSVMTSSGASSASGVVGAATLMETRRAEVGQASLPEAERAASQVLSLPVHPALSREDLETIVAGVLEVCQE